MRVLADTRTPDSVALSALRCCPASVPSVHPRPRTILSAKSPPRRPPTAALFQGRLFLPSAPHLHGQAQQGPGHWAPEHPHAADEGISASPPPRGGVPEAHPGGGASKDGQPCAQGVRRQKQGLRIVFANGTGMDFWSSERNSGFSSLALSPAPGWRGCPRAWPRSSLHPAQHSGGRGQPRPQPLGLVSCPLAARELGPPARCQAPKSPSCAHSPLRRVSLRDPGNQLS